MDSVFSDTIRDRYTVEREIGRGGMAVVHLARDLLRDRLVALKLLRPDAADALGASRFHREIRVAASLEHPNIVPVLDSGGRGEVLWYTMPYVAGGSLRQRLQMTARLPVDLAVAVARDVARALAHAHAQGVVHRDIKPENVLLGDSGALVADFGVARMLGAIDHEHDDALALPGIAIGSPAYMSPEQIAGDVVDGRTDVYALGRVLYEMLAGHLPISHAGVPRRSRELAEPAPRVRTLRPDVPAWLTDALQRALAPHADDRFATVQQFLDALAHSAA
jgi:eukaryotic-like serine/threonine-protein kinase